MKINNIQPNFNNSNNKNVSHKGIDPRNIIKTLSNSETIMATAALETFVTGGRGLNAYKRGGVDEFRERFTDDVVSAVFWMKGVDIFNSIGNKIGKNLLKLPTTEFDVGKDALRTPFKNLAADQAARLGGEDAAKSIVRRLSAFKFTKIVASTLLSTALIGFIMPKINQAITKKVMQNKQLKNQVENPPAKSQKQNNYDFAQNCTFEEFSKKINSGKTQSFKGLCEISHMLENNTICKMLTNDAGIISGRTLSARNKDESLEYLFRDTTSLFFYFASTPLIFKSLQKLTSSKGLTELDPVAARTLNTNLIEQLKNADGTAVSMSTQEFAKKTLGVLDENSESILKNLPFNSDVISLSELKKHITDTDLIEKAKEMAKLQPEQAGIGAVLTKQQVADVLKSGSINTPEFMMKIFKERFGEKLTDSYRYISMKKITSFRDNIDNYITAIIDKANKSNGGIVDIGLLEKMNKKSFAMSGGFRIFAMAVSAFALGFAIPKIQYAITERRTGLKSAPGFREFEQKKQSDKA